MTPVRSLGIIGSRGVDVTDAWSCITWPVLLSGLYRSGETAQIVTGDCRGVDACAAKFADEFEAEPIIHRVPPNLSGPAFTRAAHARNQRIVDDSDALIAIPCAHSKGTYDTIRRAVAKGIPVVVWPAMVCGCKEKR